KSQYLNEGKRTIFAGFTAISTLLNRTKNFKQKSSLISPTKHCNTLPSVAALFVMLPTRTDKLGNETTDPAVERHTFLGGILVTKQQIEMYTDYRGEDTTPDGWPTKVLLSKTKYLKEVVIQLETRSQMKAMHRRLRCPENPEVPRGPYNTLDYYYLRNLVYVKLLTDHVGRPQAVQQQPVDEDEDEDKDEDEDMVDA
ncbi:hypothetical protein QBC36DRAFT_354018, partial [Triangularia setosa]